MSTRAVRIEIALQGLDPTVPHRKVGKDGRLLDGLKVGTKPDGDPVNAPKKLEAAVVAVPEEVPARNALVELAPPADQAEETSSSEESTEDDSKKDQTDTPKKRGGFKKKVVSIDP